MSLLSLVGTAKPLTEVFPVTLGRQQLIVEDTLACGDRVWIRGRVSGMSAGPKDLDKHWWEIWRAKSSQAIIPGTADLETRINGQTVLTKVSILPDGQFECILTLQHVLDHPGWSLIYHRLVCDSTVLEARGVVLNSGKDATGINTVILPFEYTFQQKQEKDFESQKHVTALTKLLHGVEDFGRGKGTIIYLASVPPGNLNRQAELALAATILGWPRGIFLINRGERDQSRTLMVNAIDRMRWVFADRTDLQIINLEPSLTPALEAPRAQPGKGISSRIGPSEDPRNAENAPLKRTRRKSASLRPLRANHLPKYPVVFCHGMLAFSTLRMQLPEDLNCFAPLRDYFGQRGFRILFPQVPPTSGISERAASLKQQIMQWTDEPVNVIAHSMGGLDARFMITHLEMAERVRTLTTVSTPHRGTYLADWFITQFQNRVPLLRAMEAMGINVDGFRDCRLEACQEFNEKTPNVSSVRYFSYGAEVPHSRLSPTLRRAWNILSPVDGPNDGMVSVSSARWGEYLGTLHADHFAQTPDAMFLRPGETFDALGFYVRLVENLARRGF